MDNDKLRAWQILHRRAVLGEPLSLEEQTDYQAGCDELDAEEKLDGDLTRLRDLRTRIAASNAEQARMRERQAELDARIAELEGRLDARTRELLGIGA